MQRVNSFLNLKESWKLLCQGLKFSLLRCFMYGESELLLSMCERLLHFALVMWLIDHCYDELIESLFWNKD